MDILYFAYGSCMDEADFKRTVEIFEIVGAATLKDYKLAFTRFGKSRNGGVADIIPAAGEEVQGVLYRFPQEHLVALDAREGVPENVYERIQVEVWHQKQKYEAYTYQVVNKEEQEIAPSREYAQLILNGLERYSSQGYLTNFIRRLKTDFDFPDDKE